MRLLIPATFLVAILTTGTGPAQTTDSATKPAAAPATGEATGTAEATPESSAATSPAANKPTQPIRMVSNLVYQTDAAGDLKCDIYLPQQAETAAEQGKVAGRCPVVLLIHGGGWTTGDKWTMQQHGRMLAQQGIAAVAMSYHLAPAHKFPTQIDDVRKAYGWIQQQADEYQWDGSRIALHGYSAGAHLACMIGTLADEPIEVQRGTSRLDPEDPLLKQPIRPTAIVAGGTPCDFQSMPPDNGMFSYFLGGTRAELPDVYRLASPLSMVSPGDVPILYYHGGHDLMVPIEPCREICERQQKLLVNSQLIEIAKQGHLFTFLDPAVRQTTVDYLRKQLRVEQR